MFNKFLSENSLNILDSLPEAVYVIDNEFKIQFVNQAAYKITRKKPEDVLGNVCRSLCESNKINVRHSTRPFY